MNRKSIIIVIVGLLILAGTFVGFNAWFNSTAPSEAEILNADSRDAVNVLVERSEQANTVRYLGIGALVIEVIVVGVVFVNTRD